MAVNLSIKEVPDDVAEALRGRARANHRSLQGELMAMIEARRRPASVSRASSPRRCPHARTEDAARVHAHGSPGSRSAVTRVVVDASVLAAITFGEPDAEAWSRRLDGAAVFAPRLLQYRAAERGAQEVWTASAPVSCDPGGTCPGARTGERDHMDGPGSDRCRVGRQCVRPDGLRCELSLPGGDARC